MDATSRKFRPQMFWCKPSTKLKFHSASEAYDLMTDAEIDRQVEDMKSNGFDPRFPIAMLDGKILGGRNRYLAAKKAKVDFLITQLPDGTDPQAFVIRENENRRHLSVEWLKKNRDARVKRITEARQEGQSLRTIAEQEKVSESQVRRDLEESPAPGGAGEPSNNVIVGKDNKSYPASRPQILCTSCATRKRKGQPVEPKCRECKQAREAAKEDKKNKNANMDADTPEPPAKAGPMDDLGNALPKALRDTFAGNRKSLEDGVKLLFEVRGMVKRLTKWNPYLRASEFEEAITKLAEDLKNGVPYSVCESCTAKGCKDCRNSGWVPKWQYKALEAKK